MVLSTISMLCLGLLVVTWIVYPAWMRRRACRLPDRTPPAPPGVPVAVVIATRDDPSAAVARVRNLREGDYPPRLLQVVVAVDVTSWFPTDAYRESLRDVADVVRGDAPGGKAATLNAGVRAVTRAAIIVFADVGQEFNREAISRLVGTLDDPAMGGVTGRYTQHREDPVMETYADFEAAVRAGQAVGHSVVSTSGSIYAIRTPLWRDLPPGLICDDLFTTLSIIQQGFRVGFTPHATAYDPRTFTRDEQFARRVRTLTGLVQLVRLQPRVLVPWHNRIWPHFVLHKLLRLVTPLLIVLGGGALATLALLQVPRLVVSILAAAVGLAVLARVLMPERFRHLASQFGWILRLQLVPIQAMLNGIRGRWTVWTPTPQPNGEGRASVGAGT